jgi:hypothetical protein
MMTMITMTPDAAAAAAAADDDEMINGILNPGYHNPE